VTPAPGSAGGAQGDPAPPAAVNLCARVPHLAPGDPVTLELRFSHEVGTVTRIDPLEVALARPDGTTQRARTAISLPPSSIVELAATGRFDVTLAGLYHLSLTGVAHGDSTRRFVTREVELEVMGDGRLPLVEIERRARAELSRRHPGFTPDALLVAESADGARAILFANATSLRAMLVTPAGAILPVNAVKGVLWSCEPP